MISIVLYLQGVGELVPLVRLRHRQLLPNVVDPDLAAVVARSHVEAWKNGEMNNI